MADDKDSAAPSDEGSPLTRPGFLVAAVLVLVIVVLGAFLAVRVARSDNVMTTPSPASTVSQTSPTTAAGTPVGPGASVCGLPEGTEAPLTSAPAVTWDYQGTIAYPRSPEFGPGKTAAEGYRYCFQHSPAGAVMMAANAVAQGSAPEIGNAWAQYALGNGRYHDQLVDQIAQPVTGAAGTRVKIAGFRVLSYDSTFARVDLGVRASSQNQNVTASCVYELAWQNGDWRISAEIERPVDVATIPDMAGYVPWGE